MMAVTERLTVQKLIYGLKAAADPQLSPDGEWVVYGVSTTEEESGKRSAQLWLSRRDGSDKRQLTFAGKANGGARWSPDGRSISFVSDREEGAALYLLSLEGGDPKQLVKHRDGIGPVEWSPDGAKLAYSAVIDPENPDGKEPDKDAPAPIKATDRADYKQDTRGYLGDKRAKVFVYDLATGEERQLSTDRDDCAHPRWSPNGETLAALHLMENGIVSSLRLIDVASGESREVMNDDAMVGTWTWTPDGSQLLVSADLDRAFQQEIYLQSATTEGHDRLTTDLQPTPSGSWSVSAAPAHPIWLDDRYALYVMASKGRTGLFKVDTETGAVSEETVWNAEHAGFSTDASGRYVAQVKNGFDATGEVVIHDRQTGQTTQITDLNTELLKQAPPAQWERFDIERNGYTIESWLLKPANFDETKQYPMILDIHGGPNGWYGYDFDRLQQLLASNDFIVVYANPRGSGSYGGDFTRQVAGDWGGEDYLDLMAVADEAIKRPYIDAERTGVYGYSYGGYMTSWVIGHTDRFKAAVIGAPAADLISMFGTSDISHAWGPYHWGDTPWSNREWYLERSPITHLHKATTPSLILHAEGDVRCPIGQGEMVFATLKKVGVEAEFVRYPGGDHLFVWAGEPRYGADFHERILAWFKRHLGVAE
jgi:dipeptidyl aminopeptidase/acylaminoacyl peptidase